MANVVPEEMDVVDSDTGSSGALPDASPAHVVLEQQVQRQSLRILDLERQVAFEQRRAGELDHLQEKLARTLESLYLHQEELRAQNDELRHIQTELEASQFQFRDLFDYAPVGYITIDSGIEISAINLTACQMLGRDRQELLGRPLEYFLAAESRLQFLRLYQHTDSVDWQPFALEVLFMRKDQRLLPVQLDARVRGEGLAKVMRATLFDISERRRIQEQMRLTSRVFEDSHEAIMITDANANILRVNRAFTQVTGFSEREVVGKKPSILRSGRHDVSFYEELWRNLLVTDQWQGELWNRRKNGDIFPEWLGISGVRGPGGNINHYIGIFRDISEKKIQDQRIEHLAHYDALTDLPNRVLFQERLKTAMLRAIRDHRCVALLFFDLDRFKVINDTLGHPMGDLLLQQAARRLVGCARASDAIARLGGDEFTVVLGDLADRHEAHQAAGQVAEKILAALAEPFDLAGQEVYSSASLGIAIYPRDGATLADLIRNADIAMYHAKSRGPNTHEFFSVDLDMASHHDMDIDRRLHRALRHHEFTLHYQPVIRLADGHATGMEALLRWQPLQGGSDLSTEALVRRLEDIGRLQEVSDWVLGEAARMALELRRLGRADLPIGINLSMRQLRQADWPDRLRLILEEQGLPTSAFSLDISQDALSQDNAWGWPRLKELRALGLKIALDDFGAGCSSLVELKHLPIDTLKIDRKLIQGIPHERNACVIVSALIAMARGLDVQLVAEGVENPEQRDFLLQQGCEFGQGFGLSPPAVAADWLRRF